MLWRQLLARAQAGPGSPLFIEGDDAVTAGALIARATAVAGALIDAGLRPGDRVGLVLGSGVRLAASLYGVLAAGGVAVPLTPALRREEIRRSLAPCRPRAVLCDRDRRPELEGIGQCPVDADAALGGTGTRGPIEAADAEPERPAFELFSTGSTGRPRRVVRTHGMLAAEAEQFCAALGLGEGDRILGIPPLFHSYGLCCVLLAAVASGASARLLPEFRPETVLRRATRDRATILCASPFHLRVLSGLTPRAGVDLGSIRWALSCGAPLAAQVARSFHARFGVAPRQLYGASEVGSVSLNGSSDPLATCESIGTPLPGVGVRIAREDGRAAEAGEVGEVQVKSRAGSTRYEDLPELSARSFRDGWFHTGDLGRREGDGLLYLTGRTKLLINVGANKVDPLEVEAALEGHPAVTEAAVLGIASEHGGEVVKAVVVAAAPVTAEELRLLCGRQLAAFKVPRVVEFRDRLPRSPNGKLLRGELMGES